MILFRQEFGGDPQIFWSFMSLKSCFIAVLLRNFRIFSNLEFYVRRLFKWNSLRNFQKLPEIFSTFSNSKKTNIFVTKWVKNYYIDQNSAKFSFKTPKMVNFSLKTSIFKVLGAFGAKNWDFYVPKKADFLEFGSSLGQCPPKFIYDVIPSRSGVFYVSTQ